LFKQISRKCFSSVHFKSDIGVKKRQLAASKQEERRLREEIRELDLEVEDAARALRKARSQVQFAQDRLSELENRHYAILSLYSPAQAEEGVAQAIRELEENEPAARLQKREGNSSNAPATDSSKSNQG